MKIDSDIPLVHFVLTTLKIQSGGITEWIGTEGQTSSSSPDERRSGTRQCAKPRPCANGSEWMCSCVFKWTFKSVVRSNHNGFYAECMLHSCISIRIYIWLEWHIMNFKLFRYPFFLSSFEQKNTEVFVHLHCSQCCKWVDAVRIMFALSIQ